MSQAPPPSQRVLPVTPAARPQRDVPVWVFLVVILLCLAGGGAFMWWFFAGKPSPVATVKLREDVTQQGQPPAGGNTAAPDRSSDRRRRPPSNRNQQFPPLPQGEVPKGTLVTKKWEATPLPRVIRDLPAIGSTRVALAEGSDDEPKITLDVTDQPFWSVVRQIADQAKLTLANDYGQRAQIQLRNTIGSAQAPAVVHGPFMIVLRRISHTASVNLAGNQQANHNVQLDFMLAVEPGTPMMGVMTQVTIEEALDQAGNALGAGNVRYSSEPQRPEGWWVQGYASVGFRDGSDRLSKLRGYSTVLVYDKLEPFEIEDPLNAGGKSTTVDGLRVRFKQLREVGGAYRAEFEVDGHYNDPAVRYRFMPSERTIQLLDASGKPFDNSGGGWGHGEPFGFSRDFRKASGRAPAKLILTAPVGLKEVRVPFEFANIPVPN